MAQQESNQPGGAAKASLDDALDAVDLADSRLKEAERALAFHVQPHGPEPTPTAAEALKAIGGFESAARAAVAAMRSAVKP